VNSSEGLPVLLGEHTFEEFRRRVFTLRDHRTRNVSSCLAQDVGRQRELKVALGEVAVGGEIEIDAANLWDLILAHRSLL
jgi:hypothetical protein